MKSILVLAQIVIIGVFALVSQHSESKSMEKEEKKTIMKEYSNNLNTATFAGGCFWRVESDFEKGLGR
jgi:Tfp pilus assembly protein PilO